VWLSVVVPAYNEEARLPGMLSTTLAYLERQPYTWEVIVVDDGSRTDATWRAAEQHAERAAAATMTSGSVRVLRLLKNRGKGGAVKRGALCARGQLVLFADADGATDINDLAALLAAIGPNDRAAIAIGTRPSPARGVLRGLLAAGFRLLVNVTCVSGVTDTQAGFKLLTRDAAVRLFPLLHVERWAFDVELLFLAQRSGIPIVQVPIHWHECDGSKLDPISATFTMARDIIRIRAMYALNLW
jgi:dolichyl-phosphate beta-glucosyltransferase